MRSRVFLNLGAVFLAALIGCTETPDMNEPANQGAAAGGVIGAGLGALIGSQTGSAAGGMAIGALAGAGTGAAMARSIDSQDRALDEQDRAIEQQGQRMQQQRQQLEQLRGYQGDTVAYNDSGQTINRGSFGSPSNPNGPSEPRGQLRQTAPLRETDLVPPTAWESDITVTNPNAVNSGLIPQAKLPPVERAGLVERTGPVEMDTQMALNQPPPQAEAMGQAAALAPQGSQSVECNQAADEVAEAKKNTDSADKLFHYRRALRLCPDNPQYHNGLGEVYVALGRIEDAEYEFREALKIVPGYEPADRNLQGLRSAKY